MPRLAALSPLRNLRYLADLVGWAFGTVRDCRRRRRDPRLAVAVDVSPFWEPLTGIGWYLYRCLEHLAARDDLVLRLYGPDLVSLPGVPAPVVEAPAGAAIERRVHRPPTPPGVALARLAERGLRLLAPALLATDGNDLVFAPNYFPPRRFVLAIAAGTPLVATVHDLSYRVVPWAVRRETREDLERHLGFVTARAAILLTDSEAVREEIEAAGLARAERVRAVHLAPAHGEPAPGARAPAATPERYGLFVGTVEPRKNLETLLAAWRELRRRHADTPPLVVCGRVGWAGDALRRALATAADEGWLVHLGYATDAELTALYRGAAVVALPSWYEGFGLPALEACAAGAPVVASDLPVLREVLADAALFVPPGRADLWAATLARALTDDAVRAHLSRRGPERAAGFDWAATAERTAAALAAAARDRDPRRTG